MFTLSVVYFDQHSTAGENQSKMPQNAGVSLKFNLFYRKSMKKGKKIVLHLRVLSQTLVDGAWE